MKQILEVLAIRNKYLKNNLEKIMKTYTIPNTIHNLLMGILKSNFKHVKCIR